jgi:signal transduction histidine kinase
MFFQFFISNKKTSFLILSILLLFLSGLLEPVIKKNRISNWNSYVIDKIEQHENNIIQTFSKKNNLLVGLSKKIKNHLHNVEFKKFTQSCFDFLHTKQFANVNVQLLDYSYNTFCWHNRFSIDTSIIKKQMHNYGEVFFNRQDLSTYISIVDTVVLNGELITIGISQELERHFELNQEITQKKSLQDSLSTKLSTLIKICYDRKAEFSKDGREHSFFLLNNNNNKIGVATFEKPALDNYLINLANIFKIIQSVLLLIIYFFVGWKLFEKVKKINVSSVKFFTVLFYLLILRIILFYLGIPSELFHSSLTDPSNFSSVFAFGMVQSPLDFFITIIIVFIVTLKGFEYSQNYFNNREKKQTFIIIKIIAAVLSTLLFFIILRGLGASIRSVVFDSTIRYFKEFSLLPSPSVLLMHLNILILGVCGVIASLTLLRLIVEEFSLFNEKFAAFKLVFLFFVIQVFGFVFDMIQKQPQVTPFIRILFISIVFVLLIYLYKSKKKTFQYLYIGIASSIIIVSLLVFYNSEIERESLKTTAYEITRYNENLNEFILFQTLIESKDFLTEYNNEEVINYHSLAFEIWSKSLLYKESIPSALFIFDSKGNLLGQFSLLEKNQSNNILQYLNTSQSEPQIFDESEVYGANKTVTGVINVDSRSGEKITIAISTLINKNLFKVNNIPKFLLMPKSGLASVTDRSNIKIFQIVDGNQFSNSNLTLSDEEFNKIINAPFSEYNESWQTIDIGGENNLVYILKYESETGNIIAVALEEKRFAWRLSDFFKVFFVHGLIIFLIILVYSIKLFNRRKEIFSGFKTKLAAAFIIVSIIPLALIAGYIRIINEGKNAELINNRLAEEANQIESYLKAYDDNSIADKRIIYEKTYADLKIHYSIYDQSRLVFSSNDQFYKSGLLSSQLNHEVIQLKRTGSSNKIFIIETFGNDKYNSFYTQFELSGRKFILHINTLFKEISLPLSGTELDIFLFGVLSLVMILLIIFSTVLASQISSPIRKLIHATRSIGSGDLNIEIKEVKSGEIGELTSGFNMMVKRLKRSQNELAQLERETAWKEMAKQVAHEIKNPLTPMKLSVQQLVTAYEDKSPKFKEIFEKVTSTIIVQIETLKNIASEFSNFARMPKLSVEKVNIIPVIHEAVNLFSDEKIEIQEKIISKVVMVNADVDHFGRTLINLIRNSLQAASKKIIIDVQLIDGYCEIRVIDNGHGIKNENKDLIFEDSFTTKKGGMGLGLSLAKKFIESINGKIIVEKTSADGTTMLISIPVVD